MTSKDNEMEGAFNRGLVKLGSFLMDFNDAALAQAIDLFDTATQLSPDKAICWLALGFAYDHIDDPNAALVAMRRAHQLDPDDEEAEVYLLTLLAETGSEAEALAGAEALAVRNGTDLDLLRQEITEADMPVDATTILLNGFIRPRNFLRSRLEDEIARLERSMKGQRSHTEDDKDDCYDRRAQLEGEFELEQVPKGLQKLVPWVLRLGIGDDPCRNLLAEELTTAEKVRLLRDFREYGTEVQSWLDSFGERSLSSEAAAFMYAFLAAEEIDD